MEFELSNLNGGFCKENMLNLMYGKFHWEGIIVFILVLEIWKLS